MGDPEGMLKRKDKTGGGGGGVLENVDEISSRDLVHMRVQARMCACARARVCK